MRKVSEVPALLAKNKGLPADKLHCLNFFTMSIKMEYFKLVSEVIPANSNVTKPINLTSGCPKNPFPKSLNFKITLSRDPVLLNYSLIEHSSLMQCRESTVH